MSLNKRLKRLESQSDPDYTMSFDDFTVEGEPVKMFGKTFGSMDECLAYCDENDIPYEINREDEPYIIYSFGDADA